MKNINLLDKIPSLRNTIEPDTPTPSQAARKQKWLGLGVLFIFAGLCGALGFWLYKPEEVITAEMLARPGAKYQPALVEPGKGGEAVEKPSIAPPPRKAQTKPDRSADSLTLAPIVSRRVAKDASIVNAATLEPVWLVRFAVCMYKKNCDEVRRELEKKGIKAVVERGISPILMHRVVMGPWMTVSGAKTARAKLKEADVKSSFFTAGNRSYLSSLPVADIASAEKTLALVKALGYRAEKKSARSPQKIYKVYEGSYKNRLLAEVVMKKYTAIGIKCVLEKHI
ncbi:hypothetical protein MNBD_NITROSPINAE02-457 [hydrothermal vent metagenome]|uniref:SPOR domain-containing protein n=1 Tax=hydrothermal vent metagenome TaxID=652676 RepID=A0A3B1BIE3_9ZZZZ